MLDAAQAGVSSLALRDVLQRVLAAVGELFGSQAVAVWRLDESGVLRRYGSIGFSERFLRVTGADDDIALDVLRSGSPLRLADLASDSHHQTSRALIGEGLSSALATPLFSRGRPIGALAVYSGAPRSFSDTETELLEGLANVTAASIDNALLHARTERALAEVSAQGDLLRTIVESAQDGILALDAEGRILLFSPGCQRLTGWSAVDAEGRLAAEVLRDAHGGEHVCPPDCPVRPLLPLRGQASSYSELLLLGADAKPRWVGATLARAPGRRPGRVRAVMVLRDITAAKEMDELKSSLLATISHELRTPLTSIRALSELLVEHDFSGSAADEARQMAATINRESERLTRLVENVLDAARIEAGRLPTHPRPVDLAAIVDESQLALTGQTSLRMDRQIAADLPPVLADPDRLRQVLDNLLSNAAKYAASGGEVIVRGERVAEGVRVSVTDRGPGIAPDELPHIFDRFHRAETAAQARGAGLGLFITNSLVELMGGSMEVESSPGAGSTFAFTLPCAIAPSA